MFDGSQKIADRDEIADIKRPVEDDGKMTEGIL